MLRGKSVLDLAMTASNEMFTLVLSKVPHSIEELDEALRIASAPKNLPVIQMLIKAGARPEVLLPQASLYQTEDIGLSTAQQMIVFALEPLLTSQKTRASFDNAIIIIQEAHDKSKLDSVVLEQLTAYIEANKTQILESDDDNFGLARLVARLKTVSEAVAKRDDKASREEAPAKTSVFSTDSSEHAGSYLGPASNIPEPASPAPQSVSSAASASSSRFLGGKPPAPTTATKPPEPEDSSFSIL